MSDLFTWAFGPMNIGSLRLILTTAFVVTLILRVFPNRHSSAYTATESLPLVLVEGTILIIAFVADQLNWGSILVAVVAMGLIALGIYLFRRTQTTSQDGRQQTPASTSSQPASTTNT